MGHVTIQGRILKWGNSYGVRIAKRDVERLGLHAGDEATLHLEGEPGRIDLSHLRFVDDGPDVASRHDEHLGRARGAALGLDLDADVL